MTAVIWSDTTAYADGKEPVGLAFVFGFALLSFLTTLGT